MKPFPLIAVLALLTTGCGSSPPDPLLAAGEQSLVGSYNLDNLLLGPGQLVSLDPPHSMFPGMGDTLDEAVRKGLLQAGQPIGICFFDVPEACPSGRGSSR